MIGEKKKKSSVHQMAQECSFSVCETTSVQKALAGLFPATRGAPLLSVLNAINFTALLGIAADSPAGGALLQPLLTHAD